MYPQVKLAQTDEKIHDIIARRFSPRTFSDQAVDNESLKKIFEAARWAPSSSNNQPWRFFLGTKKDKTWQGIFSCLDEDNQEWCQYAPVLLLAAGYQLNRRGVHNDWFQHDVGQAMAYITFQAMSMDIYVHQMAGFSKDAARKEFNIPGEAEPITCAALGYLGSPDKLPEDLKERELAPRQRKELSEIVFSGEYGRTFDF